MAPRLPSLLLLLLLTLQPYPLLFLPETLTPGLRIQRGPRPQLSQVSSSSERLRRRLRKPFESPSVLIGSLRHTSADLRICFCYSRKLLSEKIFCPDVLTSGTMFRPKLEQFYSPKPQK